MQCLISNSDGVITTGLPRDEEEKLLISQFMTAGCGCTKARGTQCCEQFSLEHVTSSRECCEELTSLELNMVILGQLVACIHTGSAVSTMSHKESNRQKAYTSLSHQGKPVCHKMSRFLHAIVKKRLHNLAKSLKDNGLVSCIHGNTGRLPKHTLSISSTKFAVTFLFNCAEQHAIVLPEQHAILLPGRAPGHSRSDVQLLQSSTSKRAIWKMYRAAAEGDGTIHAVEYSTFCYHWSKLMPSIIIMKRLSDLCWQCQQNSAAILCTTNCPEAVMSAAIADALEHIQIVKMVREHCKTICRECNVAQLVANEDDSLIFPTQNWTDFFATRMKRIVGIKKFHPSGHYHFHPGV